MVRFYKYFFVVVLTIQGIETFGQDTLRIWQPDTVYFYEITWMPADADGRVVAYFGGDTSMLAVEHWTRDSVANGKYFTYFPSGQLADFSVYTLGERQGERTIYNEEGEIIVKGQYDEGLKHGFWAYRYCSCVGKFKKDQFKGSWKCGGNYGKLVWTYSDGELVKGPADTENPVDPDL